MNRPRPPEKEESLPVSRLKARGFVIGACVRHYNGMPVPADIIGLGDDGKITVCWPSGSVSKHSAGELYVIDWRTGERPK
jgi:hypothetical protein